MRKAMKAGIWGVLASVLLLCAFVSPVYADSVVSVADITSAFTMDIEGSFEGIPGLLSGDDASSRPPAGAASLSMSSLLLDCTADRYPIILNGASDNVTWKSSDSRIVAVHIPPGISVHTATRAYLVIKRPGTVIVTAYWKGHAYKCRVTVKPLVVSESTISSGAKSVWMKTYYGWGTYTNYCQGTYGSDYINHHGCGYCAIATIYNVFGNGRPNGVAASVANGRDITNAIGARNYGIGFYNIPSDLMRMGMKTKVHHLTIARNKAMYYIEKELYSGHPVLVHITNVNMMTGESAESRGERLGSEVHVVALVGITDRGNIIVSNPNGTVYNGRSGIQLVPKDVLLKYLLCDRPVYGSRPKTNGADVFQINYVKMIIIDDYVG